MRKNLLLCVELYLKEGLNNMKYLHCGVDAITSSNPPDLSVGDRVHFLGYSATTYRKCEIVWVDNYKWGVRYYLVGVKKDGTLGKYSTQVDAWETN